MTRPHFLQPKKILKHLREPHPQFLNNAFLDPYKGCAFGCLYCYGIKEEVVEAGAGPSPFQVGVKTSCAYGLKKELSQLNTQSPPRSIRENNLPPVPKELSIGLGFSTDPYQECEKEFCLTQRCLEILKENHQPVQILTKSELVLRDKNILLELSQKGLAVVTVSLFTLNDATAKLFEPRVAAPKKRLDLIEKLRKENIICGAALMPILPYLTDSQDELENIFASLQSCGALYCVPGILSLDYPAVQQRIFKLLAEKFPRLVDQYQALYDKLGRPALNYCQRIEKILQSCSEKYQIPTVLPVEGIHGKQDLILKDNL